MKEAVETVGDEQLKDPSLLWNILFMAIIPPRFA
jgi:hypothetical protein